MAGRLRVTLVKSPISYTSRTRGTVRALGLRRIGETVDVPDTPATRGMARAVRFLVRTEELGGASETGAGAIGAPAAITIAEPEAATAAPSDVTTPVLREPIAPVAAAPSGGTEDETAAPVAPRGRSRARKEASEA